MIHWLAEQQLVTVEDLRGFFVVTLTGRGQDVAEGRVNVPGVKSHGRAKGQMDKKPTRGRASKVDLLPAEVKRTLHEMLRDRSIPQAQILDEINALIDEAGLPENLKLSRSGLNRYATSVEKVGHNLRQLREMTSALTAELGISPPAKPPRSSWKWAAPSCLRP